MSAFNSITVTVASNDGNIIGLQIGPDTQFLDLALVKAMAEGQNKNIEFLVYNIAVSLALSGVNLDDPNAVKQVIESKTYKY